MKRVIEPCFSVFKAKNLAERQTGKYGKGFIGMNLHHYVDFYIKHPDFFCAVSKESEIVNVASLQSPKAAGNIANAVSSQLPMDSGVIFHALSGKSENIVRNCCTSYVAITTNK